MTTQNPGSPRIGILLSTFNGARYIDEQLESIRAQTVGHWTLLARDDGSVDDTSARLRAFRRLDERLVLCDEARENLGVTASYSRLVQHGKAMGFDYLMFCDQDDVWHEDKIERTLGHMQMMESRRGQAPMLVHTDLEVVGEQAQTLHPSMWHFAGIDPKLNDLERLLVQNTVTGCTAMVNRALLNRLGPIPPEAMLHDWWIALVAALLGEICPLPVSTIKYRQHGGNVAGTQGAKNWAQWLSHGLGSSAGRFHALRRQLVLQPARQAGALAACYPDDLDRRQRELLDEFSNIDRGSLLERKRVLARHGLWRQRPQHNLTLLLLA